MPTDIRRIGRGKWQMANGNRQVAIIVDTLHTPNDKWPYHGLRRPTAPHGVSRRLTAFHGMSFWAYFQQKYH